MSWLIRSNTLLQSRQNTCKIARYMCGTF